jgi:hypothetical protein
LFAGDDLASWLDPQAPGARGAPPASRDELHDLIIRYREQQAALRARRRLDATTRPRFTGLKVTNAGVCVIGS